MFESPWVVRRFMFMPPPVLAREGEGNDPKRKGVKRKTDQLSDNKTKICTVINASGACT